jgi:hypothetical protein
MDNMRSTGPEFFLISSLLRLTSVSSALGCPCPSRCLLRHSCACRRALSSLSPEILPRLPLLPKLFSAYPPLLIPVALDQGHRHIVHIRTRPATTPSPFGVGPPHPPRLCFSLPSLRSISTLLPHLTSLLSCHKLIAVGSRGDDKGDNGAGGCVLPPSRTPSTT